MLYNGWAIVLANIVLFAVLFSRRRNSCASGQRNSRPLASADMRHELMFCFSPRNTHRKIKYISFLHPGIYARPLLKPNSAEAGVGSLLYCCCCWR